MKQEDKELLLKDLCARLPYGVKCQTSVTIDGKTLEGKIASVTPFGEGFVSMGFIEIQVEKVKPYLRPMSSMTEEEQNEFDDFCVIDEEVWKGNGIVGYINQAKIITEAMDFLNQHHFDYRGLIEKGLALEAPEGMYQ